MKNKKDKRYWELVDMKASIVATKLIVAWATDKGKKAVQQDMEVLLEKEKDIDKELSTYKFS